jgi:hypothetical protein
LPILDIRDGFFRALQADKALVASMQQQLDDAWHGYGLRGAFLVYGWGEDVQQALNTRLAAIRAPQVYVRCLDPLLVVNVLARTRTALLLPNAPPALEPTYLTRVLVSDDPRLIALAKDRAYRFDPIYPPDDSLAFLEEPSTP